MITRDLECPWHDYCIICSYDVKGADFEISLYTFSQSEKSYRFQCIMNVAGFPEDDKEMYKYL